MFTRTPNKADTDGLPKPPPVDRVPQAPAHAVPPLRPHTPQQSEPVSVIGHDLAIIGAGLRIISQGTLKVDGIVQGDVLGNNVVIGEQGKVTGLVHGGTVRVEGAVFGTIRGADVALKSSARVEGDVHHRSLVLEQGAMFEGRSRRYQEGENPMPNLDPEAQVAATAEHEQNVQPFSKVAG